jgi:hypothetical protein
MLYGRILDPPGQEYLYGSTGFLFTDDLDVTNRFYDDLREAEGDSRYKWGGKTKRVLAGLRAPDAKFESERFRDGQSWNLVQRIGRHLDPNANTGELRVGRTSSQDAGVDRNADLIVATASLEVGFNDPRVGLILQHKAPHDAASFIQRRGRAGRQRGTRPWTVVALSDYGRDRITYQAYDTLFSPGLAARSLPIGNRSVLKIQGAQALLDWLALKLAAKGRRSDPRAILTAPKSPLTTEAREVAKELATILRDTLEQSALQDELARHMQSALRITADEAQALLWEPPRSLLLSVVPTALRRVHSQWQTIRLDAGAGPGDMLPEFITRALFDPLNVPEVFFNLPFMADKEESLPIERALREAVPGRVSRRYGYQRQSDRTWLPLPSESAGGTLDVTSITSRYTREGIWSPAGQGVLEVIRPHVIDLKTPDKEVTDQAQGIPIWGTEIIAPTAGLTLADIPDPSAWVGCVTSAGFATHATGNPAEVRRMTTGATCETTYTGGKTVPTVVQYTLNGVPAALGFRLTVDGVRFDLASLDLNNTLVSAHLASAGWRTFAFTTAIREEARLDGIANSFQRTWLTLVYLTAFALAALDGTRPPIEVHASLANGKWSDQLRQVLQVLYRDDSAQGAPASDRLVNTLTKLSENRHVKDCLDAHGRLLWAADVPQHEEGMEAAAIWLTETSIGGLGLIEQLAGYYAADPRRFWGLVDSALGSNDFEYVDSTLTRLLEHVRAEPQSAASRAIAQLRDATSTHAADVALRDLRGAWTKLDGYPRQSAISALSARLLRPGSTRSTDEMALAVVHAWDELQDRIGFEVDARVIAFGVGSGQIPVPGTNGTITGDQVFSVLWPRGYQARSYHLAHYQPYASQALLDRLLVVAARDERLRHVDVTKSDWWAEYTRELASRGVVVLTAPADQSAKLSRALRTVPALAVDRDVLRVYGEVREVVRVGAELRAVIDVREAVQ